MPLYFTEEELAARRKSVVAELQHRGLAALLIFRQESMYYLTGYDTTGLLAVSMPLSRGRRQTGSADQIRRPATGEANLGD